MKKLILVGIFILFLFSTLPAAILTVNKTTGPYTTISSALSNASEGDIIEITDASVYTETLTIDKNFITLRALPDLYPTLQSSIAYTNLITISSSNVIIENLKIEITVSPQTGIKIFGSKNIIKNCEIIGTNIYIQYGIYIENSTISNKIEMCTITEVSNAIYIGEYSRDANINNNTIFNCGFGVYVKGSRENLIYKNSIYNMSLDGIVIEDSLSFSSNNKIFYNTIYNCNAAGIVFANLEYMQQVYNNTIVENEQGLYIGPPSNNYDIYIKNNIIFYNNVYDICFDTGTMSITALLYNNCYNVMTNVMTNLGSATISNINNINNEPAFVDINNNDFHLLSHSPCIDNGIDIDYFLLFGVDMPVYNRRDIGAYEFFPVEESSIPPAREQSDYIRLSSNSLTIGEETSIFIVNLNQVSKDPVFLKIRIFDLRGRIIKDIYEGTTSPDTIIQLHWDGKDENNNYVGAGLYILKAQINNITTTEKIFFIP